MKKNFFYKAFVLFCFATTFTACSSDSTTDSTTDSPRSEINLKTKPLMSDYDSTLESLYGVDYTKNSPYGISDEGSLYKVTEVFANGATQASGYFIDIPEEDNLVFVNVDRVNSTFELFDNLNGTNELFDLTQDPDFTQDFTPATYESKPPRKFWGKVTEKKKEYSGNGCYTTYVRVTKYIMGAKVSSSGWVPQGTDCP